MVKRKEASSVDPRGVTGCFERTEEEWRRLGSPESLWDEVEAARSWQTYALPEDRLTYLDPRDVLRDRADLGYDVPPTVDQVLAHSGARRQAAGKWWRLARPYVLAHHDALTTVEQGHLERYRPDRWLDELDPYTTETHLFGRNLT